MESSPPSLKLDSFFLESSYPFVPHFAQILTSSRNSTTISPTPRTRPHPQTGANCSNRLHGLVHVPSNQCSHLPTHTTPVAYRWRANSACSDDRLSANPNIDIQHKVISADELLEAHKLAFRHLLRIADKSGTRGGSPEPEGETTPIAAPTHTEFPVPSVPAPLPTISFPVPQAYQHVSFDELDTLTRALQDFAALVLELSMAGSFDEKNSEAFSRLSRWFAQRIDPSSQPSQWRSCLQSALQTSRRMLDACKSEAPQLAGQLNNILQREDALLNDLRHLRAEAKVTEASLKTQLDEERSARIEVEKRNLTLTHRNEKLQSDLQRLTSDHQAALERENLLQATHIHVVQSLQDALSHKEDVDAHIRATRSFEKATERRLETLQEHLVEHRQFTDVATGSLHEKANSHQSLIVELHASVTGILAHSQQAHHDSREALKDVHRQLSEKQEETLKRLEEQNETLSYTRSRIDETRDLRNSHSQTLEAHLTALEQAIAELPSKEDNRVQGQALRNAIAIDLRPLAKEDGLSSISVTVSEARHAQTSGAPLAPSLHHSDIAPSSKEITHALRSLEEQIHKLVVARRGDVAIKELGSIDADHDDHDTIGAHLKAIERAIAALPSKEDNKMQAQALHDAIAVDLQPLAREAAVSYACGRVDEILEAQRNVATQSQSRRSRLEEVLNSISSMVVRTESIESQLHSIDNAIAELRRAHDTASSTQLSNVDTSNQETARALHSLEQQVHKLAVARHEDVAIKELGSIAAALVRLERSLKKHDNHETIGGHLEAIERAIAALPSKEDDKAQAQALCNAIVVDLQPLAKEEALNYTCSRADELLNAHQEVASQSQSLRKEIQELVEGLNSMLARTEAIDPQLHSISKAVDEIRHSEHHHGRSSKPSNIEVSDISVASQDATTALRALEEQVNKFVQLQQSDAISQELTVLATAIARVEGSLSNDGNILKALVNHQDTNTTYQDSLQTHLERTAHQLAALSQKIDTHENHFGTIQSAIADIRKLGKVDDSAGVIAKLEAIIQATHGSAQETTLENIATQLSLVAHATAQGVSHIEAVEKLAKETYEREEIKELIILHHDSRDHWRELLESIEKVKEQVSGLDRKADEQASTVIDVHGVVQKLAETQLTEESLSSISETLDHISSRCYDIVQQTRDDTGTLDAIVTKIDAIHTSTEKTKASAEVLAALKELEAHVLNKNSATTESTERLDRVHTALSELSVLITAIKADMATSVAINRLKVDVQDLRTQTSSIVEATSDLGAVIRSSDSSSTVVDVLQQKLDNLSSQLESVIASVRDNSAESSRLQEILATVQDIQSHATSVSYDGHFENLSNLLETIVQKSATLGEQITILGAKMMAETTEIKDLEGRVITEIDSLQPLHVNVAELCDVSNQLAKREHLDGHFFEVNKSLAMLSDTGSRVDLLISAKDQTQHIADKIDILVADMTSLASQVEEINVAPLHTGLNEVAAQVEGALKPTMEKIDELTHLSKRLQDKQDEVAQAVVSHTQGSSVAFERVHTDNGRILDAVKHLEERGETAAFSAKLDQLASEQQTIKESAAHWKELLSLSQELTQHTSAVQTQMSTVTERLVALPTKADTERTLQEIIQIPSKLQELVSLHGVFNELQRSVLTQLDVLRKSVSQLVAKSSETDTKATSEVVVHLQELLSRTEVLSQTTSRLDTLVQLSQESLSQYQLLEKRVETVIMHVDASTATSNPQWEASLSSLHSDLAQFGFAQANMLSMLQNITELYEQLSKRITSTTPNGSAKTQHMGDPNDFTLVVRPDTPSQQTPLDGGRTCLHDHNIDKEFSNFLDRWEKQLHSMMRLHQLLEERLRPWQGHIGSGGSVESHVPVPPEPEGYSASIISPNLDAHPPSPEVQRAKSPVEVKGQDAMSQTSGSPASGFSLRNRVSRAMSPSRARKFPTTTSEDGSPSLGERPDAGKSQEVQHHHHHHGTHMSGFIRERTLSHKDKDKDSHEISNPFLFFMPRNESETTNTSPGPAGLLQAANIVPRQRHSSHDGSAAAEKASAEKAKRKSSTGQHSGLAAALISAVSEHHQAPVLEASSSRRERVKSLLGLKKEKGHSDSHSATGGPSPRPTPSISEVQREEEHDPPPVVESGKSKDRRSVHPGHSGLEKKGFAFNF